MSLSPGVAHSCFELLGIISRQPVKLAQLRSAFGQIGVVPAERAIECSLALGWVRHGEEGQAEITPSGSRLLTVKAPEFRLRQAILDLIEVETPVWVQDATFGRKRLLSFAGSAVGQLFLEAGLVDGTDEHTVAFWDALAARARGQKNDRLLSIGREGERLTLAYERARTGREPRWISIEDNADGYDVLSVVGPTDFASLLIEVKTTTIGRSASFHLSRNEWERAVMSRHHCIHLWDIVAKVPSLATVPPPRIQPHIPADHGAGAWESVEIPFEAFASDFQLIDI